MIWIAATLYVLGTVPMQVVIWDLAVERRWLVIGLLLAWPVVTVCALVVLVVDSAREAWESGR